MKNRYFSHAVEIVKKKKKNNFPRIFLVVSSHRFVLNNKNASKSDLKTSSTAISSRESVLSKRQDEQTQQFAQEKNELIESTAPEEKKAVDRRRQRLQTNAVPVGRALPERFQSARRQHERLAVLRHYGNHENAVRPAQRPRPERTRRVFLRRTERLAPRAFVEPGIATSDRQRRRRRRCREHTDRPLSVGETRRVAARVRPCPARIGGRYRRRSERQRRPGYRRTETDPTLVGHHHHHHYSDDVRILEKKRDQKQFNGQFGPTSSVRGASVAPHSHVRRQRTVNPVLVVPM